MSDRSTVITRPPNVIDWVYDPQHDALRFISETNAALYTYSLSQHTFMSPLSLGGAPDSIAISPDGQWLVVGNDAPTSVGPSLGAVVTRVNLATSAIDHVTAPLPYNLGVAHIAVDARGSVIFDTRTANNDTYYTFAAGDLSPTLGTIATLARLGFGGSNLQTSPDHRFLLVQSGYTSPTTVALYDTAEQTLNGVYSGIRTFGQGDVANNGLVAEPDGNGVYILDQNLHQIHYLVPFGGGAVFSQDARELFAWNPSQGSVSVFDTQTWTQVGSLSTTALGDASYGHMKIVDNGTMLALDGGGHVELIDLTARLNLPLGPPAAPADPAIPVAPQPGWHAVVHIAGNMDSANLSDLLHATVTQADESGFAASGPDGVSVSLQAGLIGDYFTYSGNQLVDGFASKISFTDVHDGVTTLTFAADGTTTIYSWSLAPFEGWLTRNDTAGAFQTLLAGNDFIQGGPGADVLHGYTGDDVIVGNGGADSLYGGPGGDVIYAGPPPQPGIPQPPPTPTYLRGEDGNDYIVGGQGFDNINGNQGNDSEAGGAGSDWVVGGQGNDMLFGDTGDDIVNGNLGNDTCVGGQGNDFVRGGQGDDVLYGGDGNDWLSGDLGNNTLTGGQGADTFHATAGADVITDFSAAQGDRVQVDNGLTTYQTSQVGADVHVDLSNGGHLILENVQLSALPSGWIFTT